MLASWSSNFLSGYPNLLKYWIITGTSGADIYVGISWLICWESQPELIYVVNKASDVISLRDGELIKIYLQPLCFHLVYHGKQVNVFQSSSVYWYNDMMAYHKTVVTPVHYQWRYYSFVPSYCYNRLKCRRSCENQWPFLSMSEVFSKIIDK